VKIGTIRGAPSDRVLTRQIKAAEIVRIPLSPTIAADAADLLRSGKASVFGADSGVGYPAAEALQDAKIVPGAFGTVLVAGALPKGRSPAAQALLAALVDEAKQTGVVQRAIDAKGLKGVSVATRQRRPGCAEGSRTLLNLPMRPIGTTRERVTSPLAQSGSALPGNVG
jgi:polar amino acid transport system substrate-binding protein